MSTVRSCGNIMIEVVVTTCVREKGLILKIQKRIVVILLVHAVFLKKFGFHATIIAIIRRHYSVEVMY
jgi:hypothetical protein